MRLKACVSWIHPASTTSFLWKRGRRLPRRSGCPANCPRPRCVRGSGAAGRAGYGFLKGRPSRATRIAPSSARRPCAAAGGWPAAMPPVAGMVVELPPPPSEKRKRMDIRPDAGPFRLAVDLGTTSIHWHLLDGTGHEAASGRPSIRRWVRGAMWCRALPPPGIRRAGNGWGIS